MHVMEMKSEIEITARNCIPDPYNVRSQLPQATRQNVRIMEASTNGAGQVTK